MNPLQQLLQWISALFNVTRPANIATILTLTITNPPMTTPVDCGFAARWVNVTVFPGGDDVNIIFYDYNQKQINVGAPSQHFAATIASRDVNARYALVTKANTLASPATVSLEFWG